MADYTEKRVHERVNYPKPTVLYKKGFSEGYHSGTMTNCSKGGMYLKTDEYLTVGQPVIIKMESRQAREDGPDSYDYYYGQIRWVRNFHTEPYDSAYGYGIEYDQPVYYT